MDTLISPDDTTIIEVQDTVDLQVQRIIKDTLSIIGVGDIMMGTNFPNNGYLPPNDGKSLFSEVDSVLKSADVTFGNLEGVILTEGGNPKYCKDPTKCYIFRTPDHYVQNLVDSGFDVVSTANNHAGDFGNPGRENTMKVLDHYGIYHAGQAKKPYVIFKKNNMIYGMTAFAPNRGTLSIHDYTTAKNIVQHLDSLVDVVIVSFHGGAEGSKHQHVTKKTETFYGENRGNVYRFAHAMVDAGADVVFGHGPHVTRAMEVYNNRFIAYSLGNFCTYKRFNLSGANALAPIVKVYTTSEGAFLYGHITSVYQARPGGPKIDANKRVIKKLNELIRKDLPESQIKIDGSGFINYIE